MNCELALQHTSLLQRSPVADLSARWRAVNRQGTSFLLCTGCLDHYKATHPDWKSHIQIERLEHGLVTA